jgi:tetratricopeptide (TPR) repeat protein
VGPRASANERFGGQTLVGGRYVLLTKLGSGGMGEVLAAYDVELQRKVALKILLSPAKPPKAELSAQATQRLVREARALARLNHPNIVAIFDIALNRSELLLAMELLEGQSLTQWLITTQYSFKSRWQAMMQAGQGLAAAHEAGLIHRDFKPDNVFVCTDGITKVLDFGLVASAERALMQAERPAPRDESTSESSRRSTDLTHSGAVMGTPRFMAPEQHAGEPTDERTDIFAFCETLHLAIYGVLPFRVATANKSEELAALIRSKQEGNFTALRFRQRQRGFTGLLEILHRGMAADPSRRQSSMLELLHDLQDRLAQREAGRRQVGIALGCAGLFALAGGVIPTLGPSTTSEFCSAPQSFLGAQDIDTQLDAVDVRFTASKLPNRERLRQAVHTRLKEHLEAWSAHVDNSCAFQDHARTSHDDDVSVDVTRRCLADAMVQFRAFLAGLAQADDQSLGQALTLVDHIPEGDSCENLKSTASFAHEPEDPQDPQVRAEVLALRRELARVYATMKLAPVAETTANLQHLVARAEKTKDFDIVAKSHHAQALFLEGQASFTRADEAFVRALLFAIASRDRLEATHIALRLALVRGFHRSDVAQAREIAAFARHLIGATGSLAADRLIYEHIVGLLDYMQGNNDQAIAHLEAAVRIARAELGPDHPDFIAVVADLGALQLSAGDLHGALQSNREAIALDERRFGRFSPGIWHSYTTISGVLARLGDLEGAAQNAEYAAAYCRARNGSGQVGCAVQAIEAAASLIWVGRYVDAEGWIEEGMRGQASGPERRYPWERFAEVVQAQLAIARQQYPAAIAASQRAIEKLNATKNSDPALRPHALLVLAQAQTAAGQLVAATATLAEVNAMAAAGRAIDTILYTNLRASIARMRGELQQARALVESQLARDDQALDKEHPDRAITYLELAKIAHAERNFAQASHHAELALEISARVVGVTNHVLSPILQEIGEIALDAGDFSRAKSAFTTALANFDEREVPKELKEPLLRGLARAQAALPS